MREILNLAIDRVESLTREIELNRFENKEYKVKMIEYIAIIANKNDEIKNLNINLGKL